MKYYFLSLKIKLIKNREKSEIAPKKLWVRER